MSKNSGGSTKSKIKGALWQGFGFAIGAAVFVPIVQMAMTKLNVKL